MFYMLCKFVKLIHNITECVRSETIWCIRSSLLLDRSCVERPLSLSKASSSYGSKAARLQGPLPVGFVVKAAADQVGLVMVQPPPPPAGAPPLGVIMEPPPPPPPMGLPPSGLQESATTPTATLPDLRCIAMVGGGFKGSTAMCYRGAAGLEQLEDRR